MLRRFWLVPSLRTEFRHSGECPHFVPHCRPHSAALVLTRPALTVVCCPEPRCCTSEGADRCAPRLLSCCMLPSVCVLVRPVSFGSCLLAAKSLYLSWIGAKHQWRASPAPGCQGPVPRAPSRSTATARIRHLRLLQRSAGALAAAMRARSEHRAYLCRVRADADERDAVSSE